MPSFKITLVLSGRVQKVSETQPGPNFFLESPPMQNFFQPFWNLLIACWGVMAIRGMIEDFPSKLLCNKYLPMVSTEYWTLTISWITPLDSIPSRRCLVSVFSFRKIVQVHKNKTKQTFFIITSVTIIRFMSLLSDMLISQNNFHNKNCDFH